MSTKYSGGIITKSPVTPAGPYETGAAPGVWTVEQALQYTKQGIWPTQGNVPNYIEDVFSTYLYTGNGGGSATGYYGTQTITNGINLSANGGLVWLKARSSAEPHGLFDTARGVNKILRSDFTFAQNTAANTVTAFNTTGFNLGSDSDGYGTNTNAVTYASWTFRKQPKFFDVVTGTGQGTFNHNLGVLPGCIILKRTSTTGNWIVAHTGLTGGITGTYVCLLNTTDAQSNQSVSLSPTATTFSPTAYVGASDTWVAYFFASNAGGFGLTGTDNVISCGSYTLDGSGYSPNVELGYEPQWILTKPSSGTGNWLIVDTMRGWVNPSGTAADDANLRPNLSDAENTNDIGWPYATGFNAGYRGTAGQTWIYIAIRRGPMKVPTVGTSVFYPSVQTGVNTVAGQFITAGFPPDLSIEGSADGTTAQHWTIDRLRGSYSFISTDQTAAETNLSPYGINYNISNVGVQNIDLGTTSQTYVDWLFRRAPSFFDEVCYTGTGTGGQTYTHNLGVVPELMIVKSRSLSGQQWPVYASPITVLYVLQLNTTIAATLYNDYWAGVSPTSSVFSVGPASAVNQSGATYVAYLFATCAGVSKVGSYTGNGTTQTINCGFTGGARFVLIKRTDSTGGWYVYDTARGMTVLTDPYLTLNTGNAQTATLGSVTTVSTGFALNSTILAAINVNAGSYIFLAIA
jgi:hypothetical protein